MGLANVLKPSAPKTISLSNLHSLSNDSKAGITDLTKPPNPEALALRVAIHSALSDNTIGTNPETVLIAIEEHHTPSHRREALKQLYRSSEHSSVRKY